MLKRILMNAVDASPGNSAGAAPADVPAADVPQAQGAPVITKEVADAIASAVTSAVGGIKDSIFAEARRTFTATKQTKTKDDGAPTPVSAGAAPDPLKLRSLDRELSKVGLASRLTDAQYQRAEKAFAAEDPADTGAWVADYFNGFTAASSTATPAAPVAATQAAPAQPTNAQPASSRGAPPAPQVPLDEMNVWTMSVADRDAFIAKHGTKKYLEKARQQGKSISIDPRR